MIRKTEGERRRAWLVDYSAARARAIEWLGDRYLLARPINVSESAWRGTTRAHLLMPGAAGATERPG